MTPLQRRLLTSWIAGGAALTLVAVAHDWPHIWLLMAGMAALAVVVERPLLQQVYSIAPTPSEYFAERPLWKVFALCYGAALSLAAVSLLTFAQNLARGLSENLPLLFTLVLAPLAIPIACHQLTVFRALAHERDV